MNHASRAALHAIGAFFSCAGTHAHIAFVTASEGLRVGQSCDGRLSRSSSGSDLRSGPGTDDEQRDRKRETGGELANELVHGVLPGASNAHRARYALSTPFGKLLCCEAHSIRLIDSTTSASAPLEHGTEKALEADTFATFTGSTVAPGPLVGETAIARCSELCP